MSETLTLPENKNIATGKRFADLRPGDEPTDEQLEDLVQMVGDDVRARIIETDRKFWADLKRSIADARNARHD